MQIVFFGIYEIGVSALSTILESKKKVVAVVTKPNTASEIQPVAQWAATRGLLVMQPYSPRDDGFVAQIRDLQPDLIVVAGYHKRIPKSVLDIPQRGTINLHGSLLPKYRGPSTWKWAIINGESHTGVTVHVMTPELDNGDILAQQRIDIAPEDTGGSLFAKICETGAGLLDRTLDAMGLGTIVLEPQDESQGTYYGNLTEENTHITWTNDGQRIRDLVRGLNPRPGAWTSFGEQRLRVWNVITSNTASLGPPGEIVGCSDEELLVAAENEVLHITEMSPDGMPPMKWQQARQYVEMNVGDCLC